MVTLRVTIKGFALACLCFAQDWKRKEAHDRPPKGDHGNPSGYDQGLRPCMVPLGDHQLKKKTHT